MGIRFDGYRAYSLVVLLLLAFIVTIGPLSNGCFAISEYVSRHPNISYFSAMLLILTGFLIAYRYCVLEDGINLNQAVKIYVSIAFAMSGVYYLMHVLHQGCYTFPEDISQNASILGFAYFSFVTITTVGYGDIVPKHTFIRVLVLLQVLLGLYLIIRASQKT